MNILPLATAYTRTFNMYLTSDHLTPATGKTVTVNVSKAGGAFGAAAGTVSEIANGLYKVVLTTVDTGTQGDLSFYCTATACDAAQFIDQVAPLSAGTFTPDGTASAGSTTGMTLQASQSYPTNSLAGVAGKVVAGTGAGQWFVVKSNTNASASVLVFYNTLVTALDTTSQYVFGAVGDINRGVVGETVGSYTYQQMLSTMFAALCGTQTGGGTFKTPDGTTTRISGTATSAGVRSAITLTPSS